MLKILPEAVLVTWLLHFLLLMILLVLWTHLLVWIIAAIIAWVSRHIDHMMSLLRVRHTLIRIMPRMELRLVHVRVLLVVHHAALVHELVVLMLLLLGLVGMVVAASHLVARVLVVLAWVRPWVDMLLRELLIVPLLVVVTLVEVLLLLRGLHGIASHVALRELYKRVGHVLIGGTVVFKWALVLGATVAVKRLLLTCIERLLTMLGVLAPRAAIVVLVTHSLFVFF